MSPVSKAQQKAVAKYSKENYDRIELKVPKGQKDIIKEAAEKSGTSLNVFVVDAINEKMDKTL